MANKLVKKDISRRDLLKVGGVVAAGAAVALVPKGALAAAERTGGRRLAMVIDTRKCIGCHACSVACKAEFMTPLGVWQSWVHVKEEGRYPKTSKRFLPRLCNHCENAPCVDVCPTEASHYRDDGAVAIDEKICIGCKLCIKACPYEARFVHPEKKTKSGDARVVNKCTFCIHRVDEGVVPACVNTCMGNARIFGDLNDPKSEVARLVAANDVAVLEEDAGTMPHVFYIGTPSPLRAEGDPKSIRL